MHPAFKLLVELTWNDLMERL